MAGLTGLTGLAGRAAASGALALALLAAPATAAAPVVSYPGPGWRAVSPETGITFRGVRARDLLGMQVTGELSGPHDGRMHDLRLVRGAVWTPANPFAAGERVTVRTPFGVLGAPDGAYGFATVEPVPQPIGRRGLPTGTREDWWRSKLRRPCRLRHRELHTLPGPAPMSSCVRGRLSGTRQLLLTTKPHVPSGIRRYGAAIVSPRGQLRWWHESRTILNDLKVLRVDGRRRLAVYRETRAGRSHYRLLDRSYRPVGRIAAGNGYPTDSHDLQPGRRGSVYVAADPRVVLRGDLLVDDYVVQEVDPRTGDVLFEWHALDHVPFSASYRRPPASGRYDYFHGNAIEPPRRDAEAMLVSGRNTSALYAVDPLTGAVRWVLGGRRDDFRFTGPRRRFCAQHDVRRLPGGDLTVFDNGGTLLGAGRGCPVHPAQALRLRLWPAEGRARVVARITSRRVGEGRTRYFPGSVGSARMGPGGRTLVDWGNAGRVTEHDRRGRTRFRMALGTWSYRAVRARWRAQPAQPPKVAVRRRGHRRLDVWASWNGSTTVQAWRVLAGPSAKRLRAVGRRVRFADLETRLRVRTRAPCLAVQALSGRRRVLARSRPVATRHGGC